MPIEIFQKDNSRQTFPEAPPPLHFEVSHKDKTAACHWHTNVLDGKNKTKDEDKGAGRI